MKVALILLFSLGLGNARTIFTSSNVGIKYGTGKTGGIGTLFTPSTLGYHLNPEILDDLVKGFPTIPTGVKHGDDVFGETVYTPFVKYMKHFDVEDKYITDLIEEVLIKKYLTQKYGDIVSVYGKHIGGKYDDLLVKKFLSEKYGDIFDVEGKYNDETVEDVLIKKFLTEKYGKHFDVGHGIHNVYDSLIKKFISGKYGKHFGVGNKYTTDNVYDFLVKKYLSEKYGKDLDVVDYVTGKYDDVFGTGNGIGKIIYNPFTKYTKHFDAEDKYKTEKIYDYLVKKILSEKYGTGYNVEDYINGKYENIFGTGVEDKYLINKINDVLVKKYIYEKYGKHSGVVDTVLGTPKYFGHPMYNPIGKYFGGVEGTTGKIHDYLVKKYISEKYGKDIGVGSMFDDVFGTGKFGDEIDVHELTKYLGGDYTLKYDVETGKPYIVKEDEGDVEVQVDEETGKPYIVERKEGLKYDVETGKPYMVKSKGTVGVEFGIESGKPYIVKDVTENAEGLNEVEDSKYVEVNSIPEGRHTKGDLKTIKYGKKHLMNKFVPEV